jgi:hypothetical protein
MAACPSAAAEAAEGRRTGMMSVTPPPLRLAARDTVSARSFLQGIVVEACRCRSSAAGASAAMKVAAPVTGASRFREFLPQAAPHVREGVGSRLVEWIMEQRVDLALVHNPPRLPELQV